MALAQVNIMVGRMALISSFYEAFNRRDLDALVEFLHPEVDFENVVDGGRLSGRDAYRTHIEWLLTMIRAEVTVVKTDLLDDSAVLVHSRHHVTNAENKLWDEGEEQLRFEFRDNLISRMDRVDARTAK